MPKRSPIPEDEMDLKFSIYLELERERLALKRFHRKGYKRMKFKSFEWGEQA